MIKSLVTLYPATHITLVLWENGSMIDLNTVIPSDSGLTLKETLAINDRGQLAGDVAPTGCLNYAACGHAYILIPCDDKHPGECDDDSMMEVTAPQSSAPRVEFTDGEPRQRMPSVHSIASATDAAAVSRSRTTGGTARIDLALPNQ